MFNTEMIFYTAFTVNKYVYIIQHFEMSWEFYYNSVNRSLAMQCFIAGVWEEAVKKQSHPDVLYIHQTQQQAVFWCLTCSKGPAVLNKEPLCLAPLLPLGEMMPYQHRVFSRDLASASGPEVKYLWSWNWEEPRGRIRLTSQHLQ